MKKVLKRTLAVFIAVVMTIGVALLDGLVSLDLLEFGTKASAATITSYKQGDIIEFGWYPQSEVTDAGIISELNSWAGDNKSWNSYDYYSGTGRWYDGQMKPGNYMRYKDVVYGSNKYRGVVLDSYRPYYTGEQTTLDASTFQYNNGYYIKTIYWFKYEPVKWRVLDPATGMVMSETIIDSQAYNNFVLGDEDDYNPREYYGDREMVYFANNYAKSSIREWLNKDFYNTAFSTKQQRIIKHTSLDNSAYCSVCADSYYNSETTCDRIYLPSCEDLLNPNFGFSFQEDEKDVTRIAQGSDYSLCQGLLSFHSSGFPWLLRTAGCSSGGAVCCVDMDGRVGAGSMSADCTYMGIRPALNFDLTTEIFQSNVKDTGKSSADGRGTENSAGDSLAPDFVFSNSDYTQTHNVDNYASENDKYEAEYFSGNAVAMDGTGGFADLCVPGLTEDDNMVPQGITYYPERDWILISAYSKDENVPSVIYALDKSTGKYVAQFDIFNGNKIFTGHLGGIAVSNNNLYFSNGKSISYIPLSEFNVTYGTKKIVEIEGTQSLAGLFGEANVSYVSFSDGVLYAGNFYNETEKFKKPVMQNLNSIVVGYKLSGEDSENEWKEFVSEGNVSDYQYSIPSAITEIQCALVKNGKLYLSCSYGRKNDSRLYVVEVGSATDVTINEADFSCLAPPMMEGITFIGDELYAVFESGAYFYREKTVLNKAKNPTDVVWKIDCESLMSENTTSPGDCEEYNVLYGDGIIPVNLKQSWFRNDSLQYKHELAQLCSKFVTLGYNTDSLKSGLNALGFNSDRIFWEAKADKDKVDTFIADRNITVDGETYTLIFIGCIGTNTVQWISNFEPGTGETHVSFNDAKNYVYESLEKYIVNNKIDTSKLKILLCGHSRGAATANLLAAKLIDEEFLTTKEDIYTYTFATPNPTSSPNRFDEKYNRIYNFVNPEDFVTKVIPVHWGYGRYGRTYTLPSQTNTVSYINLNKRMQAVYDIMMKHSYHPYPGGELLTYSVVNSVTKFVKNISQLYSEKFVWLGERKSIQEFFVESLCSYLANEEGSPERKKAQDLLVKTFLDRRSSSVILSLADYFVLYQGIGGLTGGVVLDDYFQEAHQPETYCAYMMSMTASQALTERKAFMNTVNCPVDIEVYNKATGELVGKIANNVIDEDVAAKDNAIVMNVNGDSKSFWLPSDGEFDVRLSGNDNGTMDYSVSTINSADSSEKQRVNFFDVEIEYGVSMVGEFSGEEFVLEEYTLTHEENGVIEPTEILEEELKDISINVTTEGVGYTTGNITVTSGDYVTITATTNEGNDFIGWYENDILVSSDAEYSFVAKENRNLVAKFTSRYVIQWNVEGETIVTYCEPGDKINSPAAPVKDGYVFTGWTPAIPGVMPNYDLTFTAVFEEHKSSFNATCPECGEEFSDEKAYNNHIAIHNKPAKITITGGKITSGELLPGATITITAEQIDGKIFSHWIVDGATASDANSSETTIILGSGKINITAVYDNCDCKCHQGGIAGFFFKIVLFFQKLFGNNFECFCGAKH